jgi:hypothetical protein
MIDGADFVKWLEIYGVPFGGGSGGDVTRHEVQYSAFNYGVLGGVNDDFTLTLSPAITSYENGLFVIFYSDTLTNLTSTPQIRINGLSNINVTVQAGQVPCPGDIQAHNIYYALITANSMQVLNPTLTLADSFYVQQGAYAYGNNTGVANAYIADIGESGITSVGLLFDQINLGMPVVMSTNNVTNTGASTLTVHGHTYPIILNGNIALTGGEISTGFYLFYFNGSSFVLVNPSTVGMRFASVSGTTQFISVNTGYIPTNAALTTFTLPASAAVGQKTAIEGSGAGGWLVAANTGQTIICGSSSTSVAGSLASTNRYDNVYLVCLVANTTWKVQSTFSAGLTIL